MKFIPAIDLKNKKCVRLEKGKEESVTIFNEDPIEQAKFFEKNGCERIHIIDLDGAFGRRDVNTDTIMDIRKSVDIELELGGGIRNEEDVNFWTKKGIDFFIIGSLAVLNKELTMNISDKFKNKIYIALDILKNNIMIKGWVEKNNTSVDEVLSYYSMTSTNGFILTDISRDGMLQGIDINLFNEHILKTNKNIIVGGGLSSYEDLQNLKKISSKNLEGVIAGKSFYSGNIKIKKALEILNTDA